MCTKSCERSCAAASHVKGGHSVQTPAQAGTPQYFMHYAYACDLLLEDLGRCVRGREVMCTNWLEGLLCLFTRSMLVYIR